MPLDLNQSNVSLDNPVFSSMLENLQANILKGHGRDFAHHLFFQLNSNASETAKSWISQFAASITTSKDQLEKTKLFDEHKITDGGPIVTLSLSSTGYDKLEITTKPNSQPFLNGLAGSAGRLNDDKTTWEDTFKESIDLLFIVADDTSSTAQTIADNIINQVSSFAKLLIDQKGNVLKMVNGIGIEHFGYADGISQPLYLKDEIEKQALHKEWKDETNLSLLLVPDLGSDIEDSFGSYIVFRKLEQDVKGFNDAEDALPVVKNINGDDNEELAGAMLVGRFENSVPTVKSSNDFQSNPPVITNDFDYSTDLTAIKCPFHSHIRLMTPRNGDTIAGDVRERRITRRGIPYDEVERIPEAEITKITKEMLKANQPGKGVGLLFMCYQSQIENQFEILQGIWANTGQIGAHQIRMQDSIIGNGTNPDKTLPMQWGKPTQSNPFTFQKFVTMKGGEYLFTPSISFLKSLSTSIVSSIKE